MLKQYHPCMHSVSRKGAGRVGGHREVNLKHKDRIVPPRCLSVVTMSHSFVPRWALINSNFTF